MQHEYDNQLVLFIYQSTVALLSEREKKMDWKTEHLYMNWDIQAVRKFPSEITQEQTHT